MAQVGAIKGVAVSPGAVLGPVHVVRSDATEVPTWSVPGDAVEDEVARLHRAVQSAREEFRRRQEIVAREAGSRDAEIFAVHRTVLKDAGALERLERSVRVQRINVEAALQAFIDELEQTLAERLTGGIARSYAADLTDPWRGVLDCLLRDERQQVLERGQAVILAAAELTPKVVTMIERERLLGVICETGARYSHGGVLARAFGVPCVVELPNLMGRLEQGMSVAVDGTRGEVRLRPGPEDVRHWNELQERRAARATVLQEQATQPAVTPDGERLAIQVNIESLRDLDTFEARHTDGVGLLRTEFLYMERPQFPSEEEQYRLYRNALEFMGGLPVVLRTLDVGADKQLPYFATPAEPNPALGWRGTRLMLDWQDLLRVQLRAMMRAGAGRDMRILVPMITSLEEIRRTREVFEGVRARLGEQGYEVNADIPVGVMIEVPSTLFVLDELLREVDFVSVGTNDLVQYLLAVDRDNPKVARYYDPTHPAVWRALRTVAECARRAGRPCSVCGDLAADPSMAVLLLGLGYDAVSVAPHFVPEVKFAVRETTAERAGALAAEVLRQETSAGVTGILAAFRSELAEAR